MICNSTLELNINKRKQSRINIFFSNLLLVTKIKGTPNDIARKEIGIPDAEKLTIAVLYNMPVNTHNAINIFFINNRSILYFLSNAINSSIISFSLHMVHFINIIRDIDMC